MIIKSKLINEMGRRIKQMSEKDISHGVTHILDKITATLLQKKRVEIRGFGAFSLHLRDTRLAHNPKTGIKLYTKPKFAVHFKPGKEMREKINATYGTPIHRDQSSEED